MTPTPYTNQVLQQILDSKGELTEETAPAILVRALRSLERSIPPVTETLPANLHERCEMTWNLCYPDRKPWSQIGSEAQAEWMRVFATFSTISKLP
jgi:hypothetical protein